jgi:hypothetical protein
MFERLLVLSFPIILLSCASNNHKYMRGTVAMKLDNKTAHVCLGDNEVKKGETVTFYLNKCKLTDLDDRMGSSSICHLENIGTGIVKKILNNHYSIITTSGNFNFNEGTLVQKK